MDKGFDAVPSWMAIPEHEKISLCLQVEEMFLCDHLHKWIPPFCSHVSNSSSVPFYRQVAVLTQAFVLADIEQTKRIRCALQAE